MRRDFLDWASRLIIVLAAACSLGGGEAFAQAQGLAAAGPVDPGHGFPQFYQDKAGQALEPCLDNSLTTDPCGILAALPDFLHPVVFPTNFPNEFFYWMAVSRIRAAPGNRNLRADLTLALEGAFGGATGAVVPGTRLRSPASGFALLPDLSLMRRTPLPIRSASRPSSRQRAERSISPKTRVAARSHPHATSPACSPRPTQVRSSGGMRRLRHRHPDLSAIPLSTIR